VKDLLLFMARGIVDDPDAVEVDEIPEGNTTVYELVVAPDDLGKVIGKRGRTASALRAILSAAAAKAKKRVVLEIVE
jgi:uncharacterized protein